jgi:hypothetical protein
MNLIGYHHCFPYCFTAIFGTNYTVNETKTQKKDYCFCVCIFSSVVSSTAIAKLIHFFSLSRSPPAEI